MAPSGTAISSGDTCRPGVGVLCWVRAGSDAYSPGSDHPGGRISPLYPFVGFLSTALAKGITKKASRNLSFLLFTAFIVIINITKMGQMNSKLTTPGKSAPGRHFLTTHSMQMPSTLLFLVLHGSHPAWPLWLHQTTHLDQKLFQRDSNLQPHHYALRTGLMPGVQYMSAYE